MLVLARKEGERIFIDHSIEIRVLEIRGGVVKLGFSAPAEVPIHREEVYARIRESGEAAMAADAPTA